REPPRTACTDEGGGLRSTEHGSRRLGARACGDGETVTGDLDRIRRARIEPADAAGREHDGGGENRCELAVARAREHADDPSAKAHEIDEVVTFEDFDIGSRAHRLDERAHDLGAGLVAAGMRDAARRMPGLAA